MSQGSVIPEEIAQFGALAQSWWDPEGPMRPLHMLNPVRAAWVAERARRHHGAGAPILDIGCGAGLLSEALAEDGFAVTGLDASPELIAAARAHAEGRGLNLVYEVGTAEDLAAAGARFPVVTALEIIEHVADPAEFLVSLRQLLEPGGLLFLSTLNRTPRAWAVAKLGAEYVLRLLPAGTHDWRKFIKPEELGRLCRGAGLRLAETAGLSFSPRERGFRLSRDLSVNYLAMAVAD